jgi:hypothetical protein
MAKTDVYSWRLSRASKSALEEAARAEGTSVGALLERVSDEWIRARRDRAADDDGEQTRLRAEALRFVGTLKGRDPDRSRLVRTRLRTMLRRRHGR